MHYVHVEKNFIGVRVVTTLIKTMGNKVFKSIDGCRKQTEEKSILDPNHSDFI